MFHVFVFMFNFMYMSILSKLFIYTYTSFWATCLHAYIFVDSLYLDMYVYFSLCLTYICLEEIEFWWFYMFWGILSLNVYFHVYVFHITLIHSLYMVSHDFDFHEYNMSFMDFECLVSCDLHVFHEKHFVLFLTWRISY